MKNRDTFIAYDPFTTILSLLNKVLISSAIIQMFLSEQ